MKNRGNALIISSILYHYNNCHINITFSLANQNEDKSAKIAEEIHATSSSRMDVPGSFVLKDLVNETIILDKNSFTSLGDINVQLLIQNCSGTLVCIKALLGSVRIENSRNCTVLLGPCCTSTYIEDSSACTVFTTCHQLRIHKCRDFQLYVMVNSHPIVEDCANMGFAPYCIKYDGFASDLEVFY